MQCSCIWRFLLFAHTQLTESFVLLGKVRSKLCRGHLSLSIRTFLSVPVRYEIFLFLSTATHWKSSFYSLLCTYRKKNNNNKIINRWWNTIFRVHPNTRAHKSVISLSQNFMWNRNHCAKETTATQDHEGIEAVNFSLTSASSASKHPGLHSLICQMGLSSLEKWWGHLIAPSST